MSGCTFPAKSFGLTVNSIVVNQELTGREIGLLRPLAVRRNNKKIAERLVLSLYTVSGHIRSIFGKLGFHSHRITTRYTLEHQRV
jgi:DNA-binding NarL/FixJ family response regulator